MTLDDYDRRRDEVDDLDCDDDDYRLRVRPHGMPACFDCGGTTRRSGSCYVCEYCGETTGCS